MLYTLFERIFIILQTLSITHLQVCRKDPSGTTPADLNLLNVTWGHMEKGQMHLNDNFI